MRVYEAIVKGLGSIGVGAAFGGAGENAAGMMIALKHSDQVRGIITKNEQAAAFAACGYAMFSDNLGFCFATAGPGAFNLISGLSVAQSDSYPVLAVSGYANVAWRGKGSLNETSGLGRAPDSQAMMRATTKRTYLLQHPGETIEVLEEAVNLAFAGRPGAVHIHVPENLTHEDQQVDNYRDLRLDIRPVTPDPKEVKAAAELLAGALKRRQRVVLLAGWGSVRARAHDAVLRFVERFEIPVLTTLDGKGIIPESHRLAVGVFCDSGHKEAWRAFREADVVLAIGNSFAQHATFNYRDDLFIDKKLVHLNIERAEIDKVYRADQALVADARLGIGALHAALDELVGEQPRAEVERYVHADDRVLHPTRLKIHPGQMAQSLSRLLPERAIVLTDAGTHLAWLGYFLELRRGQHYRKPGAYGPMAGNTNGALGVKLAHPDRPVIVGCGDGCYLMSGFELTTAVEHQIPIIWIIFNDNEYKLIKLYQLQEYRESGLVEFQNPDWAAYAEACGAVGFRVDTLEGFEQAFSAALALNRPVLIDAHITRLALPNYAPSPDGLLAGVVEQLMERLG